MSSTVHIFLKPSLTKCGQGRNCGKCFGVFDFIKIYLATNILCVTNDYEIKFTVHSHAPIKLLMLNMLNNFKNFKEKGSVEGYTLMMSYMGIPHE